MPKLQIIYMTETTIGEGTNTNPTRIVQHFWDKQGDTFVLLYSIDTLNNTII